MSLYKDPPVSENDEKVLGMRNRKGYTFNRIAEELGMNHYTQPQEIYYHAIRNLKEWRWLKKNDPCMLKVADDYGWSFGKLMRLVKLLRRARALESYKTMKERDLLSIKGMGHLYLKFLNDVKLKEQQNHL